MAVQTRPYFVIFNGRERMVETTSPAAAVRHVVGAAVTELRPARGAEVSQWLRAKKEIEIPGLARVESTAGVDREADPAKDLLPVMAPGDEIVTVPADQRAPLVADHWQPADVANWLAAQETHVKSASFVPNVWAEIVSAGRLTLENFDRMRQAIPGFANLLVDEIYGGGAVDGRTAGIDSLRSEMEDAPIPLDQVCRLIALGVAHTPVLIDPDDVGEEDRDADPQVEAPKGE